nr:tyrosine-type recombinase/integrase [uncultured Aminipila sp.]
MFNIRMFEDILREQVRRKELSVHTMDGYLRCIRKLEKVSGNRDGPSAAIQEESINKLCQGNKQLAKYITAVKKYERDVLNSSQPLLYGEPLIRLRKKQQTAIKGKNLSYTETIYNHKINALKDVKLKLVLRLQKQSGLRISEISDLTKSDIFFDENDRNIKLRVQNGKGRKARDVHVMHDEYLFDHLKALIEPLENSEKANIIIAEYTYNFHDKGLYNLNKTKIGTINDNDNTNFSTLAKSIRDDINWGNGSTVKDSLKVASIGSFALGTMICALIPGKLHFLQFM